MRKYRHLCKNCRWFNEYAIKLCCVQEEEWVPSVGRWVPVEHYYEFREVNKEGECPYYSRKFWKFWVAK